MTMIREKDISKIIIFVSIGISILGFIIVVIGALFNGLAMFIGEKDLNEGFGLILIGNSISLLGLIIMLIIIFLDIIYDHKEFGSL